MARISFLPPCIHIAASFTQRPSSPVYAVQARFSHSLCRRNNSDISHATILQCNSGTARSSCILATDGVLPSDSVHGTGQDQKRRVDMGDPPVLKHGSTGGFSVGRYRLGRRHCTTFQARDHLQDRALGGIVTVLSITTKFGDSSLRFVAAL